MAFLAEKYPEIPEGHCHSLMIGAVTGAQTAAQLHVLLEGAKTGRDKGSRMTAEGARRTLSFYNLGFMSEDPFDPNPLVDVSPTENLPFVYEKPPEERPPRKQPEPELPGSQEEPRRERERRASEADGDDTETSSRAIELVELEIPGTQPCNRPDQRGERGRAVVRHAEAEPLRPVNRPPTRHWTNVFKMNSSHLPENSSEQSIKGPGAVGHRSYHHLRPRNVKWSFRSFRRYRQLTVPHIMCRPQRHQLPQQHDVKEGPSRRWSFTFHPESSIQAPVSELIWCEQQHLDHLVSQFLV